VAWPQLEAMGYQDGIESWDDDANVQQRPIGSYRRAWSTWWEVGKLDILQGLATRASLGGAKGGTREKDV
jgi:hypothetical protein